MSGQDVLLKINSDGLYDLVKVGVDYSHVDSIESACLIALFTDARADASLVDSPAGRRGWIGNILNDNGRELGGLLWTLDQSRITQDIINKAEDYANEAVGKLVEDGICKKIIASVVTMATGQIDISIEFIDGSGNSGRFSVLWRGLNAANLS